MPNPSPVDRRVLYQEICRSHGAIADFRAKLLALLPAASGASAFVLLKGGGPTPNFLGPLGLFGFAAVFGLFMYELRGIQDCVTLRGCAQKIEEQLGIPSGEHHFDREPGKLLGLADEIGAGWIIYTAILTSWLGIAGRGFHVDHLLRLPVMLGLLVILYVLTLVLAFFPPWFFAGHLAGVEPPRPFREGDPVELENSKKKGIVKSSRDERVVVKFEDGSTRNFGRDGRPARKGEHLRLRRGDAWLPSLSNLFRHAPASS